MASSNDQLFMPGEETTDNYILVDICANLVNKKFNRDLESVIQRATDAGVKKMIVLGTSAHTTKEALRLTRMHPGTVYCTAGKLVGNECAFAHVRRRRHPPARR